MNEDELIRVLTVGWRSRDPRVRVGVGDDCAVLDVEKGRGVVFKTDAVVEGVHFKLRRPYGLIGRKALARVLSDFAAMGARPFAAVVTVGIPSGCDLRVVREIYKGISVIAKRWNVNLVGGETTRSRGLWLSVSGIGTVGKPVLRSTARVGDVICVTGRLGGSLGSGRHLSFEPRLKEGEWLANRASAMMDLSDGLGKDLPRLASASKLSFKVDSKKIPLNRNCSVDQAINDGEDFELLFTVPKGKFLKLKRAWPFKVPVTAIGEMLPRRMRPETDGLVFRGYDHLRK